MAITTNSNRRGPGFWKLNTSFLLENNYVTKIQNTIKETKNEYANNPSVSPALLWEMMELKVREASLSYAKQSKKERADQADEIEKTITTLVRTIEDKNIEGQLREKFSKISGLRLNNKKIEVLWIGSKARTSEILCPENGYSWQEVKVKTLGVWLSVEPELTMILNFEKKKKQKSPERT